MSYTPKAIIVDDEKRSRSALKKQLALTDYNIEIVGAASNVKEGLELIEKYHPDVVFLDIMMPGESGFDLLEKVEQVDFQIIFTTAFNEYALAALKCGALDYLLKPINIEDLNITLQKILDTIRKNDSSQHIDDLIEWMKFNNNNSGKIPVADLHGIKFVDANTIIRCSADNNYTRIHLDDGRQLIASKTLKDYETILSKYGFFRCHRSHLINLKHIDSYRKGKTGIIVMTDKVEVELAQTKRNDFYKLFS